MRVSEGSTMRAIQTCQMPLYMLEQLKTDLMSVIYVRIIDECNSSIKVQNYRLLELLYLSIDILGYEIYLS